MSARSRVIFWSSSLLSVALLTCAFVQQHRLAELRAEQQRLSGESERLAVGSPVESSNASVAQSQSQPVSSELLQLRNQASRLRQRREELGAIAIENQRLKQQLAIRATNGPAS